ncbi:hypothetical protein Tco_0618374 [Tanacetum coccineum]
MTIVNQGMSVEEIEQVVAQRVVNTIEAIAIYELLHAVNEARGAKDTLGILFWGVMHKRFGVITSWDIYYDLKSLLSNVEQFKPLEEEKAHRRAIVLNDALTSEATLLCGPTVSPLNDSEIDFRISFEESDDEDYTSFQEDVKYEHVGQDIRSQDGKDDKDKQGKDLKISKSKTKSKDNDKG